MSYEPNLNNYNYNVTTVPLDTSSDRNLAGLVKGLTIAFLVTISWTASAIFWLKWVKSQRITTNKFEVSTQNNKSRSKYAMPRRQFQTQTVFLATLAVKCCVQTVKIFCLSLKMLFL